MPQETITAPQKAVQSKNTTLAKGYKFDKKAEEAASIIMSPEDLTSYKFLLERLTDARDTRNSTSHFYDNSNFIQDYIDNENARNSYLKPKKNDSETRIVTGTTEKKIEAVANELLALNFQAQVRTFNEDDTELVQLGQDMGDIVKRTNEIENDEDLWQQAIYELLCQRVVGIEEKFVTRFYNGKKIQRAEKELISGLKIFVGDITIPTHKYKQQPFMFKYDRMSYRQAQVLWKNNENFQFVKKGMPAQNSSGVADEYIGRAYTYRFGKLQDNEVEVITYWSYPDNEYQVIINGVTMFKPGTPLPYKYEGYPIRLFALKSLSVNFWAGKPLTASAKAIQALTDESIRLMVRKFQQSLEPPLAVPTKKIFSKDVWAPGAVTQGLRQKDFQSMIDHQGPSSSEFQMMKMINRMSEEFIGASDVTQGVSSGDRKSATEVLTLQRNATKQLGHAVLAVMRMKRDMEMARIDTIMENYLESKGKRVNPITKEIEKVFRSFTLSQAELDNGMNGSKQIRLMDRDLEVEEEQMLFDEEEKRAKRGQQVRFRTINVEKLKKLRLNWYVIVSPEEKEGTALDKVMFQDKFQQAVQISQVTGDKVNGDKVKNDFETTWKARDWFQRQPVPQIPGQNTEEGQAQDLLGQINEFESSTAAGQLGQGLRGGQQRKPSVNTLANA